MNIRNVVKSQSTSIKSFEEEAYPIHNFKSRYEYLGLGECKIYDHVFLTIQREYLDFILIQNYRREQRS